MQLVKAGFLDSLAGVACPSDPFVAVLDGTAQTLRETTYDLHSEGVIEGRPIPADFGLASAGSPAETLYRRTYFSYSMQAGATDVQVNVGPKMLAQMALFGDRNPWCSTITAEIRGGEDVCDRSPSGNSWNHDRRGVNIAQRDGTTTFVGEADRMPFPMSSALAAANGFVYLYRDGPAEAVPPNTGGGCHSSTDGTASTKHFTNWLTD